MFGLFNDPLTDTKAIDHTGFVEFVQLPNGFVALKTHDGQFVSQVPGQRGRFENKRMDHPGSHETFGRFGNVVTSWNDPGPGPIYSYIVAQLPNV
jgi:hypothetical protein